jgi:multiple sugar transport system ATP-binding protein
MAVVRLENITKRFGTTVAVDDVNLTIEDGEFMVLLGPSGCGKSTTLRMIAGLEAISAGNAVDRRQGRQRRPARDRDIAMVFQSYALYPHMNVRDNLAFGLRRRGLPRADIDARVKRVADTLELSELLDRKPYALSGGQRQRVALGRAVVRDPKVFLFDEPLSNLDAALRTRTRAELIRQYHQLGATMIYVTHDQVEAMTMGTRICVMNEGRVVQVGAPLEVYHHPADTFVASFIGSPPMNLIPAEIEERDGATRVRVLGSSFALPGHSAPDLSGLKDRNVIFGIRPEAIHLGASETAGLRLRLTGIELLGAETLLTLDNPASTGELVARIGGTPDVRANSDVDIARPSTRCICSIRPPGKFSRARLRLSYPFPRLIGAALDQADRRTRPPSPQARPRTPPRACDCHCHVFGPVDRFPYVADRQYTPPDSTLEDYLGLLKVLGIERAVIVQPSVYGSDNSATEDGIRRMGGRGRGVAVVDGGCRRGRTGRLHEAGFRGVRFNLIHTGGSTSLDLLEDLAGRVAPLGWHVQIYLRGRLLPEIADRLKALPVDVVIDHLGHMEPGLGTGQPGFKALLDLLGDRAHLGQAVPLPLRPHRLSLDQRGPVCARAGGGGAGAHGVGDRLAASRHPRCRAGHQRPDAQRRRSGGRARKVVRRPGADRPHPRRQPRPALFRRLIAPGAARDVVAKHPIVRLDIGDERWPQVPDAEGDEVIP